MARQTLYRHWSTREQLIADVLVASSDIGRPATTGSTPETHLRSFLLGLRERMTSPAIESATALLIAHATNDEGSAATLQNITDDRINLLRSGWGPVDEDEYALIVGPVIMQILVLRRPLRDGFIDVIVAEAMRRRHRALPGDPGSTGVPHQAAGPVTAHTEHSSH